LDVWASRIHISYAFSYVFVCVRGWGCRGGVVMITVFLLGRNKKERKDLQEDGGCVEFIERVIMFFPTYFLLTFSICVCVLPLGLLS